MNSREAPTLYLQFSVVCSRKQCIVGMLTTDNRIVYTVVLRDFCPKWVRRLPGTTPPKSSEPPPKDKLPTTLTRMLTT